MFSKHELEDVGWCFPNTFATLEFHPLTWLFANSVDIPHVHGDLCIISKPCLHKVFVKSYQLWKFLSGTHFHQSHPPLMDINWMEMKELMLPYLVTL